MLKVIVLISSVLIVVADEGTSDDFIHRIPVGLNSEEVSTRIVGGQDTTIENHPHQVQVTSSLGFCGGFIISQNWVMTAAHCLQGVSVATVQVRAGTTTRNYGGSVFNALQAIQHGSYSKSTLDYDYGLIQIVGSFTFGSTIKSIAIPAQDANLPIIGPMEITGWGLLNTGGSAATNLRSVLVFVFPQLWCNILYRGLLTGRMFCGGMFPFGGKGSCQGDSGGPVVFHGVVVGIVSFGGRICASALSPSAFARVSAVTSWIKSTTGIP